MTQSSNGSQTGPAVTGGISPSSDKTVASNTRDPQVNIQELTDRVYRLFLADLEIQRKRLHGTRR